MLALKFGAFEFFLLALFGVMICGQLTAGTDPLKGWILGILGLIVSQIGMDGMNAYPRFSFGVIDLMSGIPLIPVMIGLFGFPEILFGLVSSTARARVKTTSLEAKKGFVIPLRNKLNIVRSSLIGVSIGIISASAKTSPAGCRTGPRRNRARRRRSSARALLEGVVAAEAGNNSCIGGATIPVLSLAVPAARRWRCCSPRCGCTGCAPGPLLMSESPGFVVDISCYMAISAITMVLLALVVSRVTVRILTVSTILMPIVYVLCTVGACVISNSIFDIYLVFVFGVIGLLLRGMSYPAAPFLLGIILGPMADNSLRRALILSSGDPTPFFTRPISLIRHSHHPDGRSPNSRHSVG